MGPTSQEIKKELIHRISADAIEVTGIPANEFTVLIHELELENIGRAGKTIAEARAEAR
jgi:4-oxalocrotonate tautomerase family enzyme